MKFACRALAEQAGDLIWSINPSGVDWVMTLGVFIRLDLCFNEGLAAKAVSNFSKSL
jgi:hypothetical protein